MELARNRPAARSVKSFARMDSGGTDKCVSMRRFRISLPSAASAPWRLATIDARAKHRLGHAATWSQRVGDSRLFGVAPLQAQSGLTRTSADWPFGRSARGGTGIIRTSVALLSMTRRPFPHCLSNAQAVIFDHSEIRRRQFLVSMGQRYSLTHLAPPLAPRGADT